MAFGSCHEFLRVREFRVRNVVLLSHSSLAWRASQLVSQLGYVITIRSHLPFRSCVNKFLNFHKVLLVLQQKGE